MSTIEVIRPNQSPIDNQVYFVLSTYRDTGNPYSQLVNGFESAVTKAESLVKSKNFYAVWITVAITAYKPTS